MSSTDHENPEYWRDLAMRWERTAMENLERARDAEAAATLAISLVETMKVRSMVSPASARYAVGDLLFALRIYPNYRLDSRGPYGCVMDAVRRLMPEAATLLREAGADVAHARLFPDPEDAHDPT
jgi:hypothetical protein